MRPETTALVATVLGWKCTCDVVLQPERPGDPGGDATWQGSGFSGKDDSGIGFQIRLTGFPVEGAGDGSPSAGGSGAAPVLALRITGADGHPLPEELLVAHAHVPAASALASPRSRLAFTFDVGDAFGPSPRPTDAATSDEGPIPRSRLVVLVSGHAALKARFPNSPFGLSYLPVVWHHYFADSDTGAPPRRPAPRRILEWGPGRSTLFFAEWFPDATIDAIEHDPRWFAACGALMDAFPGGRVRIHHRRLAIAPGRAEGYVTWPLYETPETKYDLIFIDGRLRVDCAAVARLVLAPGGLVLLHDAHRENYRLVFGLFPEGERVWNTGVLGGISFGVLDRPKSAKNA